MLEENSITEENKNRPIISGIYKIENLINHKVYIGQSVNIYKRWREHKCCEHNPHLRRSFEKYGIENFSFEILIETYDRNYWEIFLIQIYHATDINFGYNLTFGGESPSLTNEVKLKISKSHKGKKKSKEHIEKILSARMNKSEEEKLALKEKLSVSHLGQIHTEEERLKRRKTISTRKEVRCLETNELFISIAEVNRKFNITSVYSGVSHCVRHKQQKFRGLHWIFEEEYKQLNLPNEEIIKMIESTRKPNRSKKIYCIELDKVFNSMADANEFMGKDRNCSTLSRQLSFEINHIYGLHWKLI